MKLRSKERDHKARDRHPVAWPLFLLSLPAFVSIWAGWVGMGRKSGFGEVNPLPGIIDDFVIDTAITLPIGLETYAAYSMYAWLAAAHLSDSTRQFAKWSAFGSLVLGTAGQAAYHVMESTGIETAPVGIVVVVASIPVFVLGLGTGLAHAMRKDWYAYRATQGAGTQDVPEAPAEVAPVDTEESQDAVPAPKGATKEDPAPAPAKKSVERVPDPDAMSLSTSQKYVKGVIAYHESVARPGRPLSQRDLAAVMGMKNRELAIQVIKDYRSAHESGDMSELLSRVGYEIEREDGDEGHDAVLASA